MISVQGASLSRGSLSRGGSLSRVEVLCQGGSLSRGSLCPRESLSRGSLSGRPPLYGKEEAVRILLGCILVLIFFCDAMLSKLCRYISLGLKCYVHIFTTLDLKIKGYKLGLRVWSCHRKKFRIWSQYFTLLN